MTDHENSVPTCDHSRVDGTFCMSPAMHGSPFCYYHTRDRQRRRNFRHAADLTNSPSHQSVPQEKLSAEIMRSLELPDLEDAAALQVCLFTIVRALAYGHIDLRRASLMIRAIRAAILNLRNLRSLGNESIATDDPEPIPPLISPCAPEPWEVGFSSEQSEAPREISSDCHSERSEESAFPCHSERDPSPEGLRPDQTSASGLENPGTRNEEPLRCRPGKICDTGPAFASNAAEGGGI